MNIFLLAFILLALLGFIPISAIFRISITILVIILSFITIGILIILILLGIEIESKYLNKNEKPENKPATTD